MRRCALLRVWCDACGADLELPPAGVTVSGDTYRFECLSCGLTRVKDCPETLRVMLEHVGCSSAPGGPITEGEIAAFRVRLGG